MEYFLLPDDIEPRKLDLVLFGTVAKFFLESESKVKKHMFFIILEIASFICWA